MRDVIAAIREVEASNDFYLTAYNDTANKQALAPLWDDPAQSRSSVSRARATGSCGSGRKAR